MKKSENNLHAQKTPEETLYISKLYFMKCYCNCTELAKISKAQSFAGLVGYGVNDGLVSFGIRAP